MEKANSAIKKIQNEYNAHNEAILDSLKSAIFGKFSAMEISSIVSYVK